ncbi:MAG: AraC-like DNA-binding protein [Lentisphaeria bacterium]
MTLYCSNLFSQNKTQVDFLSLALRPFALLVWMIENAGGNMSQCLKLANISREQLTEPYARISTEQAKYLAETICKKADSSTNKVANSYCRGFMGYGPLNIILDGCDSFEKILALVEKYYILVGGAGQLETRFEQGVCVVKLILPFKDEHLRRFCWENLTIGLLHYANNFCDGALTRSVKIGFDYPVSDRTSEIYNSGLDTEIEIGARALEIRFPREILIRRVAPLAYDPQIAVIAERQCDRMLGIVSQHQELLNCIYSCLVHEKSDVPSLESIAITLGVGPRTIVRNLNLLGTSFQQTVDSFRHGLAINFLKNTDFSIDEIACRLNYSDASNFGRAFKKWTGRAPRIFRQSNLCHNLSM